MIRARTILAISILSSIGLARAQPEQPADATTSSRCQIVHEGLRNLQAMGDEVLGELRSDENQAKALGDWFGRESYEPYIGVLRAQRKTLEFQLNELKEPKCPEDRSDDHPR
jgi:hypothetical protein